MYNFTLEIPGLNFESKAAAVSSDEDYIYITFFILADEAVGRWGKVFIKSRLFKRKRTFIMKEFIDHKFDTVSEEKNNYCTVSPMFIYNKKTKSLTHVRR